MKTIKTWASAHKASVVAATVALVLVVAGGGAALALGGALNGESAIASEEGQDDGSAAAASPVILEEVPEGAEVVEDENAPEGTVAVKAADGTVSYVPTAKANEAVSNGTASRPSAGSGSSGSTGGGSAATPTPAPEPPKHVCSASVPKTVVDQAAWTEQVTKFTTICGNCGGMDCHGAQVCPMCGDTTIKVRYLETIAEHPAVTHTEWYCTCGAKM